MIKHTMLADTGISISRIGLGTVKFGRNQGVHYPDAFGLPTNQAILALLDGAQSLGINLLDTAPAYGASEERLGKLLKTQRQNWVICTKAGEEFVRGKSHFDFSPAAIQSSVERSLQRLHTDMIDIVLVHSNGDDEKIIAEDNVFQTLSDLKRKGYIRAFGMSTKTIAGGLLTVEQADVVMVTYNPLQAEDQKIITAAHQKNKGIFIKKALSSGHLDKIAGEDPVLTSMQFIFNEPGVSSVILGTLNFAHLQHDVLCAENALGGMK